MVSQVVTVPSRFFERDLPLLRVWDIQVYLHVVYLHRWSLGQRRWISLDLDEVRDRFCLKERELGRVLQRLVRSNLIVLKEEEGEVFVQLY